MQNPEISICLSSDNNYTQHLAATISSILKTKNPNDKINIYILDGGISTQNKQNLSLFEKKYDCKITYLSPDTTKLNNCKTSGYLTLATYYRLLIPELIQNEDRIIYLDCDIIVRHSLFDLYNKDFKTNLVLGVEDVSSCDHAKRLNVEKYINAGVLLLNLKQMHEENTLQKILDWLSNNQDKIDCHDQDVINASINDRIEYIEDIYNAQVRRKNLNRFEKLKDPTILHFISPKKPWSLYKPINSTPWAREYFEALKDTPWEDFIYEYKKQSIKYLIPNLLYPTGIFKNILRTIFSIKNSHDRQYKILTIFGIEIRKQKIKD